MTAGDDPPTRGLPENPRSKRAEALRWLAENAPADLLDDRLPSQGALGSAVSYDAIGVDPRELEEVDTEYRKKRRRNSSDEPPPPTQSPTRSEYLEQQSTVANVTGANSQGVANPNRVWSGGHLVGKFDHHLDPDQERDAALEEVGPDEAFEPYSDDWDGREALAVGLDRRDLDDLDDRPLWQRELDLSDDDLEDDWCDAEAEPPEPQTPALCVHCAQKPIKYAKKGWCARCHEYQRTHGGQLPPLRLTVGRRQR